jgi:hypothetical protein
VLLIHCLFIADFTPHRPTYARASAHSYTHTRARTHAQQEFQGKPSQSLDSKINERIVKPLFITLIAFKYNYDLFLSYRHFTSHMGLKIFKPVHIFDISSYRNDKCINVSEKRCCFYTYEKFLLQVLPKRWQFLPFPYVAVFKVLCIFDSSAGLRNL